MTRTSERSRRAAAAISGSASSRNTSTGFPPRLPLPSRRPGATQRPTTSRSKVAVAVSWLGATVLTAGALLAGSCYLLAPPSYPRTSGPSGLTDDERIERMRREQRDLEDLNRWQQDRLKADGWDRMKGR